MKQLLSVGETSNRTGLALLIARIGIAALMLTHGIPKLMTLFSSAAVQFPPVLGMSAEFSLALVVFAEVFCSLLILAGLATRLAVVPLAITMLVAALIIHGADPLAVKEPALQYLLVYVILFVAGSGKYSVDNFLQRKKAATGNSQQNIQDPTFAIYQ